MQAKNEASQLKAKLALQEQELEKLRGLADERDATLRSSEQQFLELQEQVVLQSYFDCIKSLSSPLTFRSTCNAGLVPTYFAWF